MHIVMIMHPRKPSHAQDTRVYSEYDIKGASTACQEAHNVFLYNRPSEDDLKNRVRDFNDRELKIAKMRRRGKFAGHTIVFKFENEQLLEKELTR